MEQLKRCFIQERFWIKNTAFSEIKPFLNVYIRVETFKTRRFYFA